MSLGEYESSRYSGEPINLYLFRYGAVEDAFFEDGDGEQYLDFDGAGAKAYFAYTDGEDFLEFGVDDDGDPIIYTPIAIDRGKLTSSGTLDKSNVTVITPHDSDLANLYLVYPPSSVTTLVMYQGHVNDEDKDFRVVWSGRVIGCARKGSQAQFTCEPISTMLRRNGLRRRYQYGCPHVLYGPDCRASKSAATVSTTVASFTGSRITLPAGWAGDRAPSKFLQGLAEWRNPAGMREVRTILRIENGGTTFLLGGTTRGLSVGTPINMVLGCNHKSGTDAQPDGDCGPLHHNILNFGGQERIPFKNPIGLVNNFY